MIVNIDCLPQSYLTGLSQTVIKLQPLHVCNEVLDLGLSNNKTQLCPSMTTLVGLMTEHSQPTELKPSRPRLGLKMNMKWNSTPGFLDVILKQASRPSKYNTQPNSLKVLEAYNSKMTWSCNDRGPNYLPIYESSSHTK